MFKDVEEKLTKQREINDASETPNHIDQYIVAGMKQGQKRKVRTARIKLLALSVSLLLVIFTTSVRLSPAFASYVNSIPGLSGIVQLIHYDKGLRDAIEHEFILPIGVSDEHEGITFTVDGVIVDETRMVIFFSITSSAGHRYVSLHYPELQDEFGNGLNAGITFVSLSENEDLQKTKRSAGKIDVGFVEGATIPNILNIDTQMIIGETREMLLDTDIPLNSVWSVEIPIDKNHFAGLKEEYEINEIAEIEEQRVLFEKVIIYPTRIAVYASNDDKNTKQLFNFKDIR